MKTHINQDKQDKPREKISRKEALKKAGKYAAFTATAMFVILSPQKSQATSPSPPSPQKW